jgi:hypothetical protein
MPTLSIEIDAGADIATADRYLKPAGLERRNQQVEEQE